MKFNLPQQIAKLRICKAIQRQQSVKKLKILKHFKNNWMTQEKEAKMKKVTNIRLIKRL